MELECSHCGGKVTRSVLRGGFAYLTCPSCSRVYASAAAELGRTRPRPVPRRGDDDPRFAQVKQRLDAWLLRLDEQDPYHVLGVHPRATVDEVKARFRQLALQHHPDRGGDPREMDRVSRAYERIRARLEPARVAARAPKRLK